jgi:hypothetical protein
LRVTVTGLGVVLCTTLIGCKNQDQWKDKSTTTKQQQGTGLPNTPQLPPNNTSGVRTNTTPNQFGVNGSNQFGGTGGNLAQPVGGSTYNNPSYPRSTGGVNTLTSPPQQYQNYPSQPGVGMPIGVPTQPGVGFAPPAGTGLGGAGSPPGGYASNNPPEPKLPLDGLTPPPPPSYSSRGSSASDFGSGAAAPIGPVAPVPPIGGAPIGSSGIPPSYLK